MKEFTSQIGGRYTYTDDILNLQELSLAVTSLFDGCDNFIMSGCTLSGTTLSDGYVYINGKIRYCSGATNLTSWPIYLCEHNTVEKVSYVDSGDKIGRNVYGCIITSTVPTSKDALTNTIPQYIKMLSDGSAVRMKDAFLGKYALTLNSSYNFQQVNKNVMFNNDISVTGNIVSNGDLKITNGDTSGVVSCNNKGDIIIQSTKSGRNPYKLTITNDGIFQFLVRDTLIAVFYPSSVNINGQLTAPSLTGGNIKCEGNNIYDYSTSSNNGSVKINMNGYSNGTSYYRDTIIGDGKGAPMFTLSGTNKTCYIYENLFVSTPSASAINIQHSTLSKSDKSLIQYIRWQDKSNATIATVGFSKSTDYDWYLKNYIGDIKIDNDTYITGNLYVSGESVMSTLAKKTEVDTALNKKADITSVYTKADIDNAFIKRTDSVDVFVKGAGGGENGKASVRDSIGAASVGDIDKAVLKANLFKDVVQEGLPSTSSNDYVTSLESRQRTLCENIGAPYKDDVQLQPNDTGWIKLNVENCDYDTELYVRQIGHFVSIQGQLHAHSTGKIFTLPNNIDPPKYDIGYSNNKNSNWCCEIKGGSRDCKVTYSNSTVSKYIGFLMTYLV